MLIPSNQMIPALNVCLILRNQRNCTEINSSRPDRLYAFCLCVGNWFYRWFYKWVFPAKEWIIVVGFSIVTAMVVYTTIDLSRPLRGIIKDDAGQQAIIELRKMF